MQQQINRRYFNSRQLTSIFDPDLSTTRLPTHKILPLLTRVRRQPHYLNLLLSPMHLEIWEMHLL